MAYQKPLTHMDVTNPTITHGEVVLLVGGNSGQRGRYVYLSLHNYTYETLYYKTKTEIL